MRVPSLLTIVLELVSVVCALGVPQVSNHDALWQRSFLAPRNGPIRLHIGVRLDDDGADVARRLHMLSSPSSPDFRRWASPEQAASMATPQYDSVLRIEAWLSQHGLRENATVQGAMIQVDTTVHDAEHLLNTTYWVYSDGTRDIVRTDLYHLPDHMTAEIDFVTPTTHFPRPAMQKMTVDTIQALTASPDTSSHELKLRSPDCHTSDYTTPTCVRQVYEIDYVARPNRTTFAIYATEGASYSARDLRKYLAKYNPAADGANFDIDGHGGSASFGGIEPAFETALDTQTAMGLAWPANGILFNRGGIFGPHGGQIYDPFVQFLHEMTHNETVPSVVSFSEGMPENQMDAAYARRLCTMMAQVGARGVTLLFSSGDNGPNGDQPTGKHERIFEPEFPASCPFVTAVGGTTNLASEMAATKSTIGVLGRLSYTASGGGFSNLFHVPNYQAGAAVSYVVQHVPASYHDVDGFSPRGRGIPDVSAFSTNFPTVVAGLTVPVGGTSAATPLWAAIVTLLNDREEARGRPPLGFINPWLYSLRQGLTDIVAGGDSAGSCYRLAGCDLPVTLGYNVTKGWDPVTGLGSPVFSELAAALDAAAESKAAEAARARAADETHFDLL